MVVVVDEAYVEFVRMADAVDGLATYRAHPNVVLFRTFSKAYGLAGFRVGYAVAQEPVAAALRAVSLPFGVSAVAQAAAIASLEAEDELLERVDALVAERDRVVAGAAPSAAGTVPEPQGNFVWFALGERTADFAAAADEAGIVVRPFAGEGCRVSIGEPEANDRLLEVAAGFALRARPASVSSLGRPCGRRIPASACAAGLDGRRSHGRGRPGRSRASAGRRRAAS